MTSSTLLSPCLAYHWHIGYTHMVVMCLTSPRWCVDVCISAGPHCAGLTQEDLPAHAGRVWGQLSGTRSHRWGCVHCMCMYMYMCIWGWDCYTVEAVEIFYFSKLLRLRLLSHWSCFLIFLSHWGWETIFLSWWSCCLCIICCLCM